MTRRRPRRHCRASPRSATPPPRGCGRCPRPTGTSTRSRLALSFDPDQAYEFVRDRIGFDPYEGVLRGAEGTLAARAGNALDRALLLAALLDAMGVEHRFAVADLDDASVDRLLERALVAPPEPLPTPGIELTALDASAVATRATRDYARLREALGDRVDAIPGADANVMREALRHHAWVQAAFGTGWRDLDPTLPDAVIGSTIVPPSETPASLPDDAWHTVTLRVVAGTVGDAGLTEHTVIERTFRADEAAASDVFVTFVPYDANLGSVIAQALSGDAEWVPLLVVETDVATGEPFAVSSRGTDVFGDPTEIVELATMRLIVERRAPDGSTSVAERVLLDRLPEEASQRRHRRRAHADGRRRERSVCALDVPPSARLDRRHRPARVRDRAQRLGRLRRDVPRFGPPHRVIRPAGHPLAGRDRRPVPGRGI